MPRDRKRSTGKPKRPDDARSKPDFPPNEARTPRNPAPGPARSGRLGPLLRGVFVLFVVFGIAVAIGSYFIRKEVIRLLAARSFSSTSFVLSRPFPLESGLNVKGARLVSRLERLGFRDSGTDPAAPGEFHLTKDALRIYLRETTMPSGAAQHEQLIELKLDQDRIISIEDMKFRRPVPDAAIEPEIVSLLSDSSTRAVTRKRLDQFAPLLVQAVLGIEDERFYRHLGVDPVAILRAVAVNVRSGGVRQGGSTITQQLAKNLFFSSERSISRKLFEAFAALLIETAFTKDQILEFYLNEVFLGQEGRVAIHGFGEASLSFYGKNVEDLSLAEAATLAGMIKAPTRYSPRRFPENAKERKGGCAG